MKRERLPACVALLTDTSCAQILLALSRTATARSTELGEAAGGRGPPPCGRGAYRGVPAYLGARAAAIVEEGPPGHGLDQPQQDRTRHFLRLVRRRKRRQSPPDRHLLAFSAGIRFRALDGRFVAKSPGSNFRRERTCRPWRQRNQKARL